MTKYLSKTDCNQNVSNTSLRGVHITGCICSFTAGG